MTSRRAAEAASDRAAPGSTRPTSLSPAGSPRRILLVGDDPASAARLRRILEADFEVIAARPSEAALDSIRSGPIDAIVCDGNPATPATSALLRRAERL